MKSKIQINKTLKNLEKSFDISQTEMKRIIKDFHSEMDKGLRREKSSLKMIPTYVKRPTGNETGKFIALDLGGTNFRILELELKGHRKTGKPVSKSFVLDKKYLTGRGEKLFDFIADCIKIFMKEKRIVSDAEFDLGFTFSFPVEQTSIASGTLLRWTKGFSAEGVIGKDVVKLLNDALAREGIDNVKVTALVNDTVGTLVAKAYEEPDCDIGVILGTGTNACYSDNDTVDNTIINTEWGNFNKLKTNSYDAALDAESENRGSQVLEKMVSGMYLGELFRLAVNDIVKKNFFSSKRMSVRTEYMSEIERDRSKNMSEDRRVCKKICEIISTRAARISAAALAAVITKIDPELERRHTIAIDGSVYEKYPGFSKRIEAELLEIFAGKSSQVKIALTKDGSGKGAAIIAAVARAL